MSNEIGDYIATKAEYYAVSDILGYDQSNREGEYETDCSQLYARCANEALVKYGFPGLDTSAYSGNIVDICRDAGASVCRYDGNPYDLSPGDALVEEGVHVVIGLGNGNIVQASYDENGGISGGMDGDQTGYEVNVSPAYHGNWDYCISWTGFDVGESNPTPNPEPIQTHDADITAFVQALTKDGWGERVIATASEGLAVGDGTNPIFGLCIGCDEGDGRYRVHVKGGDWLPWVYMRNANSSDGEDGWAGDDIKPCALDLVQVEYLTPDDIRPYKYAFYHVRTAEQGWLKWKRDIEVNGDDFAGDEGQAMVDFSLFVGNEDSVQV